MRCRTTILSLSLAAAGLLPRAAAAADHCTPSRAMIVLDKSSSMQTGKIGSATKWSIAVGALDAVTSAYESSIELGLMIFPSPNQCSPGSVFVEPGLGQRDEIVGALGAPPPTSGNYTPMAETLDAAANVPSLNDPARSRYVILITDGWQWCYPYDPSTRFAPVDAVKTLKAKGVTTFVVGFGDAVDALALNQMAVEAGTALAGCDPTGDTPTAANPCYYRAEDSGSLVASLMSIAVQISAEVCDGIDNDCDGVVDEDLVRECTNSCGGVGQEMCMAGVWSTCDAPACDCAPDEVRGCGIDVGACERGTQTCGRDGRWSECVDAVQPGSEACDGLDNDCDGVTDEADQGSLCPAGQVCSGGACVEEPTGPAIDGGGEHTGCGCRAGGATGASARGLGLAVLAFALVAFARRRR